MMPGSSLMLDRSSHRSMTVVAMSFISVSFSLYYFGFPFHPGFFAERELRARRRESARRP
jgi:hypothetical protein